VLELDKLGAPERHLRVVVANVARLEERYGRLLAPRRRVARPAEEYVAVPARRWFFKA
jgi:hypothetical protein